MRDVTKRRLERAIWLQRAKWVGVGLAICVVMAGIFTWISADQSVQLTRVPATVTAVRPPISTTAPPSAGVSVPDMKPENYFNLIN